MPPAAPRACAPRLELKSPIVARPLATRNAPEEAQLRPQESSWQEATEDEGADYFDPSGTDEPALSPQMRHSRPPSVVAAVTVFFLDLQ